MDVNDGLQFFLLDKSHRHIQAAAKAVLRASQSKRFLPCARITSEALTTVYLKAALIDDSVKQVRISTVDIVSHLAILVRAITFARIDLSSTMSTMTKSSLNNLPQHILSQILSHAISDSTEDEALRLRLTNKNFNHEVLHVIFEKDWVTNWCRAIPNEVTLFRYFRGFLMRRECDQRLLALRQCLLEAAVILTDRAKSLAPIDQLTGPFSEIYESRPEQCPSEEAIAALATSTIHYLGGPLSICKLWTSTRRRRAIISRSDDDASSRHSRASDEDSDTESVINEDETPETPETDEHNDGDGADEPTPATEERGPWTALALKDVNFWVLLSVSYFGKLELVQNSLASLRQGCGSDVSLTHDLQSVFQLPVHQGHQHVVKYLLEQPEFGPMYQPQSFVLNNQAALETAIKAQHVSIVKTLFASGWDISHSVTDYTAALMYSIRNTEDVAIREELVTILLGLTQEWRSSSMTGGIFREICSKGDVRLAELVLKKIKDNTESVAPFTWSWTLPDRYEDWHFDEQCALEGACTKNNIELVQFLFREREHLPKSMKDSYSTRTIRSCLEQAIILNNREMLHELLKHKKRISPAKLLVFAVIKGDLETLKLLVDSVDLNAKVKRDRYFQSYDSGSNLSYELSDLEMRKTPFAYEKDLITIGTFCLIVAIKALKPEHAKCFIDKGVRIGTRLTYLSRNFVCNKAALLAEDTSSIGTRAFVLTYKQIYLPDCKNMLSRGAKCFDGALVLTKTSSRWGWKLHTAKVLKDCDAKVISCIQIPECNYNGKEDEYIQMWELLEKHKLPLLFVDDE